VLASGCGANTAAANATAAIATAVAAAAVAALTFAAPLATFAAATSEPFLCWRRKHPMFVVRDGRAR